MPKETSLLYYIFIIFSRLPLSFLRGIGYILGNILYHSNQAKTLQSAQLNLKIAFPELSNEEFSIINKQATINEVISYFEFISIWGQSTRKNISRVHQVYGEELFYQALEEKKGIVLIVPHFGTWEIMNAWLSQHTTLTIMYKPNKNTTADAIVKRARCREHANLVPTNESGVKEIFKALKKGGTTAILPDHSPDQAGDLTPWFGIPLYSSHLSAKLIKKTRAKALLLYATRNENSGFDMHIQTIDDAIYTADCGTSIIHSSIEHLIKQHPEHYHWSYKRFQASPLTRGLYDKPQQEALDIIETIKRSA